MSWAMFGFCMARVGTLVLRIAWTTRSTNAGLAIAANIFTNIGVLVIYIVLLLLVMRVFRATHPSLGWNKLLRRTVRVSYVLIGVAIILVIAFTILTFYTLNPTLRTVALWIQRAAILYILIFNIVTVVLLLLSWLLPRAADNENFGTGSMDSKLIILGVAVFFSVFIAGFRTGLSWSDARPASNAPWYDSKAAFYVIELGFEIVVLYLLLVTRFDKRFWVPNGSNQPGDYSQVDLEGSTAGKTSERDNASEEETMSEQDRAQVHNKTPEEDKSSEEEKMPAQDKAWVQDKTLEEDEAAEEEKMPAQDKAPVQDKTLEEDEAAEEEKMPAQDKAQVQDKTLEEDKVSEQYKVSAQGEV